MKTSILFISLLLGCVVGCKGSDEDRKDNGGGGGVGVEGGTSGGKAGSTGNAGTGNNGTAGTNAGDGTSGTGTGIAGDGSSGTAGTGSTGNDDVTPQVACERIAAMQCDAEQDCCDDAARKSVSRDACVAQQVDACKNVLNLDGIGLDARTGYDVNAANAAFADFEAKASTCDLTIVDWASSEDGFAGVLKGSVEAKGTCTPKNTTDSAAVFTCKNDYACMPSSIISKWTCVPRAGSDGRCFSDISCEDGFRCDPDQSLPTLGKCLDRKPTGESCVRGAQCDSLFCEGNGDCADEDNACTCVDATQARLYCLQAK